MNTRNLSAAGPAASLGSSLRVTSGNGSSAGEVRHAVRGGHPLVTFRSTATEGGTTVECEVRTVSDPAAPARIIGPHTFASPAEARSFGDELMLALEYLGCELVEGER